MEILIPGLVLVGFMIWASTRIKQNAAKAFEREEIETSEFTIVKPEGFLAPVDPKDGLLFDANSKDFGRDEAEGVRQASAEICRFPDAHFEDICERAKIESKSVTATQIGVIDGSKCANIVVERVENEIPVESFYKIIAGREAVYQLVVTVLPDHKEDFSPKIDELLDSFSLV